MEFFAIGAAVLFLGIAAFFFFENSKLHKRIVSLDEQLREAKHNKSSKSSKPAKSADKPETVIKADPELERDLDDARGEIKDLKKQVYDLKNESKELRDQLKDASESRGGDRPDSDLMFELREEIADLKTENARLTDELKDAKSSRRSRPEPKPEKREAPAPPPAAAASAAGGGADTDSIREKYDRELTELRDEARQLNRKLKSTASNVDKQRRRADNNDRAYKITQRQYDAAQERVSLLEAQLEKAGITPVAHVEPEAPARPEVSSEPPKRTPAAIAADEAAEAERKAAEEAAKAAPPKPEDKAAPPPTPSPSDDEPADQPEPPPTPGVVLRKAKKPAAEDESPEVGSTTVLSPSALASAAAEESSVTPDAEPAAPEPAPAPKAESATQTDDNDDGQGDTVHRAKPVAPEDFEEKPKTLKDRLKLKLNLPKKPPAPKPEEPAADESGGHTAIFSPGAFASKASDSEAKEDTPADESGGHTAVLSASSLSKAVTGDSEIPDGGDDSSEPHESGEQTAILSAGALASTRSTDDEPDTASSESSEEADESGGRRPSSGLFGMPDDVFDVDPDDEQDPIRSTQFAFPTQMVENDDDDADSGDDGPQGTQRLGGGRLGDMQLDSAIEDALDDGDAE